MFLYITKSTQHTCDAENAASNSDCGAPSILTAKIQIIWTGDFWLMESSRRIIKLDETYL